ncbi:hypothetical protein [Bradyrhizobium tunisiense]|uniref:hypothetical protein n=1 Tax=Bradyrhizobium tunisiense TaxID=3278709 RepID=UPI0035D80C49
MLSVVHDDCRLVRAETIFVSSQGRFFGCIETVWKLWSKSDQTSSMDGDEELRLVSCGGSCSKDRTCEGFDCAREDAFARTLALSKLEQSSKAHRCSGSGGS